MKSLYCKRIGIIGMGKSGVSAANLARSFGADVFISDSGKKKNLRAFLSKLKKGIRYEFGGHSDKILDCDLVIKSPGVPEHIGIIRKILKNKIPLISELEFALGFKQQKPLVAITGTNGKTTTTALTGKIFANSRLYPHGYQRTVIAGNIGTPLSEVILRKKLDKNTVVVLEISSYQLEGSPSFHPNISAILNITPDHLEHHGTMKAYIAAKTKIFANQGSSDYCVLNYDNMPVRELAEKCHAKTVLFSRKKILKNGVCVSGGKILVNLGKTRFTIPLRLKLPGNHNVENVLAAVGIAACAGVSKKVIESTINAFKGVEHRIEFVKTIKGVRYYNDSKATNVDSTKVALESFGLLKQPACRRGRYVWLVLGGRGKGSSYKPLIPMIKRCVKEVLLIGEDAPNIRKDLSGSCKMVDCNTLERAVKYASKKAVAGDVFLFSPACASFDQFKNFEDRGKKFKKMVSKIK
jgi:UDP-N-acetylmuramoylalanine--D-glutamate ligase